MANGAAMALRMKAGRRGDPALIAAAAVGGAVCVVLSVALAGGEISGQGPTALGSAAFLLVVGWCLTHRRVDRTVAALALYLGLLDGYVKLSTGSTTVTLARDVLVVAIAAGALWRSSQETGKISLPPLSGFVFAFCAAVLVEFANPSSRGLSASFAGARQHLEFVPLFFLGYAVVRTEAQIRSALLLLVFCAAVGGVVSYIQSTLTPEQLASWGPGYSQRVLGTGVFTGGARVAFVGGGTAVRPFGLGSDAGAGAIMAALAFPGLVALLMVASARVRWVLVPLAAGIGLAVATSGSRAGIITVFVALMAFGLLAATSRNGLKAVVGVTVAVAVIYTAFVQLGANNATAQRAQSITPANAVATFSQERGQSVSAFGGLLTGHPLGVGLGTVGPAASFGRTTPTATYNSETEWNFLVVETGIAGVIVYVTFLFRLTWLGITRIRRIRAARLRLYIAALAAPILSLLVAGFSGPTSAAPPAAPYLWLVAGVLAYHLVTMSRVSTTRVSKLD